MTELKVAIGCKGKQLEIMAYVRKGDDSSVEERGYANALLDGINVIMEVMSEVEADSATITQYDNPTEEMKRRLLKRLKLKGD